MHRAAQGQAVPFGQAELDGEGAGHGIGTGRNVTHLGLGFTPRAPGFDRHRLAHFEQAQFVLGQGDHHIIGALLGHAHHRRARRQNLTDLGLNGGDHTAVVGRQAGVCHLVALGAPMRLGLVPLGLRGFEGGFAPLQFGPADERLVFEFLIALEVGLGQFQLGLRCPDLGASGFDSQFIVARVQVGQALSGLDPLAQLHMARHQFARHPKAQAALDPGTDIPCKLHPCLDIRGLDLYQFDSANRFWAHVDRLASAQAQQAGQGHKPCQRVLKHKRISF